MKLKAKADILLDSKRYKTGEVFEASTEAGLLLIEYNWAEKVKEAKKKK